MSEIVMRKASMQDARTLGRAGLRDWDRKEIAAFFPDATVSSVIAGQIDKSAHAHTAVLNGKPIAVGGVVTYGLYGQPWMLATKKAYDRPVGVVHAMRENVRAWMEEYPGLANWVARDNIEGKRLLQMLGFSFVDRDKTIHVIEVRGLELTRFRWGAA